MPHVLIIDSEKSRSDTLAASLDAAGLDVLQAASLEQARRRTPGDFAATLTHVVLDDAPVADVIRWATPTPVLVYAGTPATADVVAAMRLGAVDFVDLHAGTNLAAAVSCIIRDYPRRGVPAGGTLAHMVGVTEAMCGVFEKIRKVAPTESTVLIRGESGTGKELVARALHENSRHARAPMISLNCAAIPDTVVESELFGHEHGAFPEAGAARNGLVQAADGGTLFLDEIGELPLDAQARLLRVIQDGEVRRVGSVETRRVDVRLIAATHRNLQKLLDEGRFRDDLYYRLNVVTIDIPPLRERKADLDTLADTLLERAAHKLGIPLPTFSTGARRAIVDYHWPGNVRELENAIERAVILCDGTRIDADHLAIAPQPAATADHEAAKGNTTLEDYFVNFVLDHQDQMTETELAQKLGISRKSLWERRQRLDIPRKRTRRRGTRSSAV